MQSVRGGDKRLRYILSDLHPLLGVSFKIFCVRIYHAGYTFRVTANITMSTAFFIFEESAKEEVMKILKNHQIEYSLLSISCGHISEKSCQKYPHILPVRRMYRM